MIDGQKGGQKGFGSGIDRVRAGIESRITAAKSRINSAQFELRLALSQLRPDGDTYPKAWRNECHHLHGDSHRPAPAAIAPDTVTMV